MFESRINQPQPGGHPGNGMHGAGVWGSGCWVWVEVQGGEGRAVERV